MFLAEFRSIKNKRIGGTYTFDLMLEVPSAVKLIENGPYYENVPCTTRVIADVDLVGVIRHVRKKGFVGAFNRVPEPENDDTYEQVVYRNILDMTLWTPMGLPFGDVDLTSTSNFTVTVFTNREDARFVVIDKASQEVLGAGSGKEAKITFPPDSSSTVVANVKYLNIITTNEKQNAVTLIAPIGPDFDIMPNTAGAHTDYGDYRVK